MSLSLSNRWLACQKHAQQRRKEDSVGSVVGHFRKGTFKLIKKVIDSFIWSLLTFNMEFIFKGKYSNKDSRNNRAIHFAVGSYINIQVVYIKDIFPMTAKTTTCQKF